MNEDLNQYVTELRDTVFGPCTVIGECFSIEELKDDLLEAFLVNQMTLADWFNIRMEVECRSAWPEDKYPDGPTEQELAREQRAERELVEGISRRWQEFIKKEHF
jgi:hypothetical protein